MTIQSWFIVALILVIPLAVVLAEIKLSLKENELKK